MGFFAFEGFDFGVGMLHQAVGENEAGRRAVVDHPGRFGLLAALPLPDVDAAIAEIEHCHDRLDVDGFALLTHAVLFLVFIPLLTSAIGYLPLVVIATLVLYSGFQLIDKWSLDLVKRVLHRTAVNWRGIAVDLAVILVVAGMGWWRAGSARRRRSEQRCGEFHPPSTAAAEFHCCRGRPHGGCPFPTPGRDAGCGQTGKHGDEVQVAQGLLDHRLGVEDQGVRERKVAAAYGHERPASLRVDVGEPVAVGLRPPGRFGKQLPGVAGIP